jgi:hypothetical protein
MPDALALLRRSSRILEIPCIYQEMSLVLCINRTRGARLYTRYVW